MPEVEVPLEKWTGKVHEVRLGGNGRKTVVVGGEATLPFLQFEGAIPNRPAVAIEVHDVQPMGWPSPLAAAWGDVLSDPALWAKKAAEYGADIIALRLRSAHPEEGNTGADEAKKAVDKVLGAVDLPLIVLGPEVAEKDNLVLVAASEAGRGQRLALGNGEEKNYRTLGAACIADGHVAIAKTPIEINLAKQLNILLCDLGVSPESILMDPTLAALTGDGMTAMPMICTVGEESWRQKESKSDAEVPATWGDLEQRALIWEEMTASTLLNAGADIVVLRHPKAVEMIKATIDKLMG
jgi:acetyl-CoA decarbonylase/synthase complex subunit delta